MSWRDRPYAGEGDSGGGSRPAGFRLGGGLSPAVKWLIIANVAVAIFGVVLQYAGHYHGWNNPLYVWGQLNWRSTLHGQVWRLVTYQYLHEGIAHIGFNMLSLYFLGPMVERLMGSRRFFWFYTFCGVVAGLLFMAMVPVFHLGNRNLIGASGSICGVLAAAGILLRHQRVYLFFAIPMRVITLAAILGAMYLVNAIARNLSDVAHLGGMIGGAVWVLVGPRMPRLVRRGGQGGWQKRQLREQRQLARDAEKVDRILAKVHERGINSLTWWEKRTLRQATERQRERDREQERRLGRT